MFFVFSAFLLYVSIGRRPPTPHTHALSCVKNHGRCAIIGLLVRCLAIAQLMDRLRERCVQDLLPEFTGNVAPFFQLVMIPSNGFIDVYSQVRSHTESYGMPCCHGACHSFDDSRKKTKTCWFEVPGTWPHPHCCCTPGQCPRILSPFTISNCQNQMNLKKLTTSHRFGTKSCSSVWHELERLPNVCCSTRGCSHRFALHTCYLIFWWEAQQINNFGFETTV